MREHEPAILDRTAQVAADRGLRELHALRPAARPTTAWPRPRCCSTSGSRRGRTNCSRPRASTGGCCAIRCPAARCSARSTPQAAAATGLPVGTPVVLGGHDYCCGALPTGAFRPGVVLDVTGTWEMVVAALPEPVLTPAVREMGILVDSHVARGALGRDGRDRGRRHARMVPQASSASRRSSRPSAKAASIGTT